MAVPVHDAPRVARWLGARLRAMDPPLPVKRDWGGGTGRHIVYFRSGGVDRRTLVETAQVRSVWTIYVSQPVQPGQTFYIEDLEADADRMHEAVALPIQTYGTASGRIIQSCYRDLEHNPNPIRAGDGVTITELQLGGIYVIESTVA